jgi:Na+/H+-dicarboxylate symporter
LGHKNLNASLPGRIYALFISGPGVIAMAVIGLVIGSQWSMHSLPEQFQEVYTSLFRMFALPFLVLTIVYAISRLRPQKHDKHPGLRIMGLLSMAMLMTGIISITVSLLICEIAEETVSKGIGSIVTAFDNEDVVEVTFSAANAPTHTSLLLDTLSNLVPSNIFHALSVMDLGQIIIFLIIFAVALLNIPVGQKERFVFLVGSVRRPFELLMEKMHFLVPIAVFFYAVHASHVVSADDLVALRLLFRVIAASSLTITIGAIFLISLVSRRSPLTVASEMKDAILAGILSMTEEAALAKILENFRGKDGDSEDDKEVVASLGLAVGRFGMITILASVLSYCIALYHVPLTAELLLSVLLLAILAAVLITGLNGPGVLAAAMTFCGGVLGLPLEALMVLVILLEPVLEILLIPVSVSVTNAMVTLMSDMDGELAQEKLRASDHPVRKG